MDNNESSAITQRKQHVSGIFDGAASTYGQVGPKFFTHFGRRLVEVAQVQPQATVLDVATGRGAVLYPALEAVGPQGKVVGIDLSEKMIQATRQELANTPSTSNANLQLMDAEHLQFADETFDYVLCGFAIFFFPQLSQAMAEFQRVLKPRGKICVSTFDKSFYKEWDWFLEIVKAHLPAAPQENQDAETNSEASPIFDTAAGVEAIMQSADFGDIEIFSETAVFVYTTAEEFWSTLWSHGMRETVEKVEQETGPDGLHQFKLNVFQKISEIKQADGLHQSFPVHIGLAVKQ